MTQFAQKLATALSGATLLFAVPALAQTQALPAPVADQSAPLAAVEMAPTAPTGPALWMVADDDTTIYMFGTVHALPKDVDWYGETIANALESSDTVVTEIRMDPQSEAAMQQLAVSQGTLPAGTTLRSLLDEDQIASYEAALGSLGVPPAAFDRLKPWLAGLTMTMLPLIQQGYSPDAGVDKVVLSKAEGKQKDALETAEFQIGLFDGMSEQAQIAFLIEATDNVENVKQYLDAMVQEWAEGDADALAELMNEGMTDPALAEALLYQRNANWADWIDIRLDSPGTVFMAVGAGHLAGEKSVQDYLSKRGIDTTRVQ